MKKKNVVSSILIGLLMTTMVSVYSFADVTKFVAYADFVDFIPKLIHEEPMVDYVLSSNMVLKPKTVAHLSLLCSFARARVKYFFNGDSSNERQGKNLSVLRSDEPFYPSTGRISNSYIGSTIDYKISGMFQTITETGEVLTIEAPMEDDHPVYHRAVIVSSYTTQVDFNEGKTIVVGTGDQSQPPYTQDVPPIAGLGIRNFTIYFGTLPENGVISGVFGRLVRAAVNLPSRTILLEDRCDGEIELEAGEEPPFFCDPQYTVSDFFSSDLLDTISSAKKVILEYNVKPHDQQASVTDEDWIDGTKTWNLIVNKETGFWQHTTVYNATYRIVAIPGGTEDSDYRPDRRTIVKSRIGTKYPGFEFNYLHDGDVVKIYNVNGKKVREIDYSDGFVWNGRTDDGDWAKSGIYIYQIKLKKNGKIISGTISFVW
jgi:hypothetical protein